MKNIQETAQDQSSSIHSQALLSFTDKDLTSSRQRHTIIVGLMVPMTMMVLNFVMFGVAVPAIRNAFSIQADMAAWLVTAYTLPFMIFMPLYGELSDGFGKRRLFLLGIMIFLIGTVTTVLAPSLRLLFLGRAIQGIGTAGINPLSMAIISEHFPRSERGKALGTWNSIGPVAGMAGPFLAGFLIDYLGWRVIFGPILVVGLLALFAVRRQVPTMSRQFVQSGFLRNFDWLGVILLSGAIVALVLYVSSRPITGVEPFHDWRFLAITLLLLGGLSYWERKQTNPFLALDIFGHRSFARASFSSAIRMFLMSGVGFLIPLYLVDVYQLSAAAVGSMMMIQAGALTVTMRFGGQLADRWGSRWPVVVGTSIQVVIMAYFALLPGIEPLVLIMAGLASHGLGAGLSLAAMHRSALSKVPRERTGSAAGLYSMIRFGGVVLGIALDGVILQQGLEYFSLTIDAYRLVFMFMTGVAILGVLIGWGLGEET